MGGGDRLSSWHFDIIILYYIHKPHVMWFVDC